MKQETMVFSNNKCKIIFLLLLLPYYSFLNAYQVGNDSLLLGIQLPDHPSLNSDTASKNTGCRTQQLRTTKSVVLKSMIGKEKLENSRIRRPAKASLLKLHLKHKPAAGGGIERSKRESVKVSSHRDVVRIQTLHRRITEKKNQNTLSRLTEQKQKLWSANDISENRLVATLESGVSLGSGEYFMDVFIGTPPKHYSLILDTGSDLNWIQCLPCHDCFDQNGPPYDPEDSRSFRNISCRDPMCNLVSSPVPPKPCKSENQTCPYFYWYGDSSNTTGDFALETFTVNLTTSTGGSEFRQVENVMFGCGHWNRGLFHGASGLLGFGRGPLSFSSQLRSFYGHTFSYCLVDRNSNMSVSSKLIFGEDKTLMSHKDLNFTSFVAGKENPVDTFYYVQIRGIMVGGDMLEIPVEAWKLSADGVGGTIIDSGTTLSYFAEPAYRIIKEAFVKRVKGYPLVKDFPLLDPCYNVSGVTKLELPEFAILFGDGAMWNFPSENYFFRLEPEEIVCLAFLGTPPSSLSIIGNYQQQNFHILYDTEKSRLGFAPMRCTDV